MMKIRLFWLVFLIFALLVSMGAVTPEVFFAMKDPLGDEHGYGTYQYPSNIAFQPYQGLFDIVEFKVWEEKPGLIYFDTTFTKITNPWVAPEGFIHQNLRIMVDNVPESGMTELPKKGACVSFHPKYGWDFCLKVVGWGNSQLIVNENGNLKYEPLKTMVLGDNRTIRASLPESVIGKPDRKWKYYVLVGSFDGFGEDFFRKVRKERGEWVIGGGLGHNLEPKVMDLLAPRSSGQSQIRQLKSFDVNTGKMAVLYPVGRSMVELKFIFWLGVILVGGFGYGIFRLYRKQKRICWFWVKQSNQSDK